MNGIDPNALEVGENAFYLILSLCTNHAMRKQKTICGKKLLPEYSGEWLSERFFHPFTSGSARITQKNEIHFGLDSQTLWKEILFSSPDAPLLTRFQSLIFLALPLRETGETEQILNSLVESAIAQK